MATNLDHIEGLPKGWIPIGKALDGFLQLTDPGYKVLQAKEKFGGLRYYTGPLSDLGHRFVQLAEDLSLKTCEVCGAPGKTRPGGWIVTLCDEHARK